MIRVHLVPAFGDMRLEDVTSAAVTPEPDARG
jgi:hypothetical protein